MKIRGWGTWTLRKSGLVVAEGEFDNLVTEIGDRYFMERAASPPGVTPPAQLTGAQLGTGTALPTKTGTGAAIVTYIAGSSVATESGFPTSSLPVSQARRIQWSFYWAVGVATNTAIAEIVMHNQAIATNAAAPAANTIARALISPVINKPADQDLRIVWNEDGKG